MITNEQIARVFNKHGANFFAGARELIALAQQVKPLEFVKDEDGDYCAKTILGEYWIYVGRVFIFRRLELKTLEEAIEAANNDFRKLVLSCLVHGGV